MNIILSILTKVFIGISPFLSGFLGGWGGADGTSKSWRRIGCTIVLLLNGLLILKNQFAFGLLLYYLPLMQGYGRYSPDDPKPSTLGKFWHKILNNGKLEDIAIRGSVGLAKGLTLIAVPYITGKWLYWLGAIVLITLVNILFGGDAFIKNEGHITIFGKKLLKEEIIINGLDILIAIALMLVSIWI